MKSPLVFYLAIALVVVGLIVGVYYLIPGFHHVLFFSLQGRGASDPNASRPLHALVGLVLLVVGAALFFVSRPKKASA